MERRQYAVHKGKESREFRCPFRVGQSSNLGPLLFNLFINDTGDVVKRAKLLLYADDLKMYHVVECIKHCEELQSDLDDLVK